MHHVQEHKPYICEKNKQFTWMSLEKFSTIFLFGFIINGEFHAANHPAASADQKRCDIRVKFPNGGLLCLLTS